MMAQWSASGSKTIPESYTTHSLNVGSLGLPDCCTYTSHGVVCQFNDPIRVSQGESVVDTEESTEKTYKYNETKKPRSRNRRKVKATMDVSSNAERSRRGGRGSPGGRGALQNRKAYIVPSFHDEIGPDLRSGSPLMAMNSTGESSIYGKNKNKNENTV